MSYSSQLAATLSVPGAQPQAGSAWTKWSKPLRIVAVFLPCLGLALLLQLLSGAYGAELSHAPDEPSHVVTALMLRDYIHDGFPQKALAYAENYYIHYPKVGLGVWPPMFYVAAMVWMLVFGASKTALLWFMAVQCATWATLVFYFSRRIFDPWTSFVIAVVTICTPLVQYGTSTVMLDVAIGLLQFWSMLCLLRFIRTGNTRSAVLFGFVTAAAMLTKGNSNCLLVMAPILLVLSRRWYLIKRPGPYVAAAIVLLCGAPWQYISLRFFQGSIPIYHVDAHYVVSRFTGYTTLLANQLGLTITVLGLLGLVLFLAEIWRTPVQDSGRALDMAGAVALFAAVILFHAIAPVPGPDNRYLTPAVPLAMMFAAAGLHWIARRIPVPSVPAHVRLAVCGVIFLLLFSLKTFAIPGRPELGFGYAADLLTSPKAPRSDVFLICSDAEGEGAFITEVAIRDRRPDHIVLRGTKILSENEWHVTVYRPLFKSPEELRNYLRTTPVDAVVIDDKVIWPADREILLAAVQGQPEWQQVADIPAKAGSRHLLVYRNSTPNSGKRKNIRFKMRFTIGRDLELH